MRVTEALLFAANLYDALGAPGDTKLSIRVAHRGIAGRTLSSSNPMRGRFFPRTTQVDESQVEIVEETGRLRDNIVADVRKITEPLFMLFDFTEFDAKVYEEIITSFVNGGQPGARPSAGVCDFRKGSVRRRRGIMHPQQDLSIVVCTLARPTRLSRHLPMSLLYRS